MGRALFLLAIVFLFQQTTIALIEEPKSMQLDEN